VGGGAAVGKSDWPIGILERHGRTSFFNKENNNA
jgi:hypothetical protein